MKYCKLLLVLLMGFLLSPIVSAQEDSIPNVWEVNQLTDHIYKLSADGGGYVVKVIASIGDDGILIVDAGQKRMAEDLKSILQELGGDIPRYIISTHSHVEHTGGTAIFGPDPTVIGHENLRKSMRTGSYLFDEFPEHSLPELVFSKPMSLFFNGEEVKILPFIGAHDDCDLVIWFTKSKVACVGALSNGDHFPSVDGRTGDVRQYPVQVEKLIALLPEDTYIIPGHGADGTMQDLAKFHTMLVSTEKSVCTQMEAGKDLETMQADSILDYWQSYGESYTSVDRWIEYLFDGCQGPPDRSLSNTGLYEAMYYAIRDEGAEAAVNLYHDLKANHFDEYEFSETFPLYVGYKLFTNERFEPAVEFFELGKAEYPDDPSTWMCYYFAARSHSDLGNKTLALDNARKAVEMNPESTDAASLVEQLENE